MDPDASRIHGLFSGYDLYYLDPLIVKDASQSDLRPEKKTRSLMDRLLGEEEKPVEFLWYERDTELISDLLANVRQILGLSKPAENISYFFDARLVARLSEDRGRQKQIVDALFKGLCSRPASEESEKDAQPKDRWILRPHVDAFRKSLNPRVEPTKKSIEETRIVSDLNDMNEKLELYQELPNRSKVECLVALEGTITTVSAQFNSELYQSVLVTPRHEDHHLRSVRFCLAPRPGMLLGLDEWRVGLMVDQKGLAKTYPDSGSEVPVDLLALDKWYPFAMAIGFWRTDRGGRPFVDVLAILIKSFPSMDRILKERGTTDQRCFLEMLKNGKLNAEVKKKSFQGGAYDPRGDYDLLYPYLLATLCCHLNNTDWKKFQTRGRLLFDLSSGYWQALVDLANEIRGKAADSWLPDVVDGDEKK